MAKNIDPQAPADEFQVVPGKASWKGVNTHDDPSAIDDNEFQWAQNIRINGSKVNARRGQEKFIDATLSGPVDGIWNSSEDSSMALYYMNTNVQTFLPLMWLGDMREEL